MMDSALLSSTTKSSRRFRSAVLSDEGETTHQSSIHGSALQASEMSSAVHQSTPIKDLDNSLYQGRYDMNEQSAGASSSEETVGPKETMYTSEPPYTGLNDSRTGAFSRPMTEDENGATGGRWRDGTSYGFETPDMKTMNTFDMSDYYHDNDGNQADAPIFGRDWKSDSYPAWNSTQKQRVPIPTSDIAKIFGNLKKVFGFQTDNMRNVFDLFMSQLDSRSSRMPCDLALETMHADYIGGTNSNYHKWTQASNMAKNDQKYEWPKDILTSPSSNATPGTTHKFFSEKEKHTDDDEETLMNDVIDIEKGGTFQFKTYAPNTGDIESAHRRKMNRMSPRMRVVQIALFLLCWGEANQVRFMPECLCFIFKCALDYYENVACKPDFEVEVDEGEFLSKIITPIYRYYVSQQMTRNEAGDFTQNEADHRDKIGYDDINQLFWHDKDLMTLKTQDGQKLLELEPWKRYNYLSSVIWEKAFYKTYKERRSYLHMLINFNRIWILHLAIYWFYTAANVPSLYTENYDYTKNTQPSPQFRWTIIALGGNTGPVINLLATLCEMRYIPRRWPSAHSVVPRIFGFVGLICLLTAPSAYILLMTSRTEPHLLGIILSVIQMVCAVTATIVFSVIPLGKIFRGKNRASVFTGDFAGLKGNDRALSWGLWLFVWAAKLTESYFFLTLSLRDPVRELGILKLDKCIGSAYIGQFLCQQQAKLVLCLLIITDLVLFMLDSYLWYIIFNTIFSVCRSFYLGASIWTPWRNVYCRLPKRMFSKVMYTRHLSKTSRSKLLVSQVWNAIVVSMYREHLIPLEQVQRLIYVQEKSPETGEKMLYEPAFFVSQEDSSFHTSLFEGQSEAERRISFFAQSLSTPIPEPVAVESMPTFTVLIPHYSEKIVLSLRETIVEQDADSKISLLEYLKGLHGVEWDCFVKDSMGLANDGEIPKELKEKENSNGKPETLPFYCVGFKSSSPEYILRTRLWASLRTQTLYRTISGFMNYPRAIKLLYSVETLDHMIDSPMKRAEMERELSVMARRKFRLLVAVQRLSTFSEEEITDKEMMLRAYPELNIAYLEEEIDPETKEKVYYSCLTDGESEIMKNGQRKHKYKVRLSGNPILGDGKSDNQNHSLIFYRGEYIQLVDANQDNYLEECLKIRSVLAEFEEMDVPLHPYALSRKEISGNSEPPVAIIGAREYIFSENIGVLGDVAAGKEQTFGTLFARTLAKIGGKLHYGHPDFLNGIFMTTRGGVSKAQKGLHLNEDIYAGMNALLRGGRIKHCEYNQCGKGRDLGFGSILNFTTKIGAGMGEQMLSREYYYIGTMLPIDRFLSFYYAHPGFHINNKFIVVSLELFLVVTLNLAALAREAVICKHDANAPITDEHQPLGCQNLIPVFLWVQRCVLSIFIVFFISFLPLFVQELTERGFVRSITRLAKHFGSLSPLFEVFVCQIYSQSLSDDLSVGGARYIPTGRGFATTRLPFSTLYSRFGATSIYLGARLTLILVFVSTTMWSISLLWFWVTTVALCLAPCIFNPHQFSFGEFFMDYRAFIHWLHRGNERYNLNSWIGYHRVIRTRVTGFKRKAVGDAPADKVTSKPSKMNSFMTEVARSFIDTVMVVIPYLYVNSQSNLAGSGPTDPLLRLMIITMGPIVLNFVALVASFVLSSTIMCAFTRKWKSPQAIQAALVHGFAVFNHLCFFELMWLLEGWNFPHALLGTIAALMCQSFLFKTIQAMGMSREYRNGQVNVIFWSGQWANSKLGFHTITQPFRELICKCIEMSMFTMDFTLGHFLLFVQTPFVFIPYMDQCHTLMLFWLSPKKSMRSLPPMRQSLRKLRRKRVPAYIMLYFATMMLFVGIGVGPLFIPNQFKTMACSYIDGFWPGIVQPPMRSVEKDRMTIIPMVVGDGEGGGF